MAAAQLAGAAGPSDPSIILDTMAAAVADCKAQTRALEERKAALLVELATISDSLENVHNSRRQLESMAEDVLDGVLAHSHELLSQYEMLRDIIWFRDIGPWGNTLNEPFHHQSAHTAVSSVVLPPEPEQGAAVSQADLKLHSSSHLVSSDFRLLEQEILFVSYDQ